MTTQRTPGPWSVAKEGERLAFPECCITATNGRPIASTIYPLALPTWRSEDVLNAEFIVRACNNHEALLAALKSCQRLFNEALPKFNWGASALDANAIRLLNETPIEVDAAIATAKKGA